MPRRTTTAGESCAVAASAPAQSPHPRQNQAFDGQTLRRGELDGKTRFLEGRSNRQEHNGFCAKMTRI